MSDFNTDMAKFYLKGRGPKSASAYRRQRFTDKHANPNKKKDRVGDIYLPTISIDRWNKGGKISKYYKAGGNIITGR